MLAMFNAAPCPFCNYAKTYHMISYFFQNRFIMMEQILQSISIQETTVRKGRSNLTKAVFLGHPG